MKCLLICSAAFLTSGLTLFSGFGLGTLLLAILASFLGARLLVWLADVGPLARYRAFGRDMCVTPVKLAIGVPMVLTAASGSAFLGAWVGSRMIHKVTMRAVQRTVAVMLFVIAFGLAAGII